MTFSVKDIHGKEYTGQSEDDLIQLAKQGLLTKDCAAKKTLIAGWFRADELKFLKPYLPEETATPEKNTAKQVVSSFERKYTPVHAGVFLRGSALLLDLLILAVFTVLCGGVLSAVLHFQDDTVQESPGVTQALKRREKKEKAKIMVKTDVRNFMERSTDPAITDDELEGFHPGSVWMNTETETAYYCLSAGKGKARWISRKKMDAILLYAHCTYVFGVLLILLLPLTFRAQTYGMKFFGIFLSDAEDVDKEVLQVRSFCYLFLSIVTSPAAPFLLLSGKPTVAERIMKTRVIGIASA